MKKKSAPRPRQIDVRSILKVAVLLVVLAALAGTGVQLGRIGFFRIGSILIREGGAVAETVLESPLLRQEIDLSAFKGENIFSFDVREAAQQILGRYPLYQRVKVVKIYPNRIFVDLLQRTPVVCVKMGRYYAVDTEFVFFDVPEPFDETSLPLVVGIEKKLGTPKRGSRHAPAELVAAMGLVGRFQGESGLKEYRLRKIDASDPSVFSLFLSRPHAAMPGPAAQASWIEVKLSATDGQERLALLGEILQQMGDSCERIRYIDIRFREPVIKFKDMPSP